MKTSLSLLLLWLGSGLLLSAQIIDAPAEPIRLRMTGDGGANGAAVAYHPEKKLYYAAFAGNGSFPLEAFREDDLSRPAFSGTASADLRGMWYNPQTKSLEANAYDDGGIIQFRLDKDGLPVGSTVVLTGDEKPDGQAVGVYNPGKKEIWYFNSGSVYRYKRSNGKLKDSFRLSLNTSGALNTTTLFYTGQKGAELGVLDITGRRVLLFAKDGSYVSAVKLPLKFEPQEMFNCSFANKRVWIFNKDRREWAGYQIFK